MRWNLVTGNVMNDVKHQRTSSLRVRPNSCSSLMIILGTTNTSREPCRWRHTYDTSQSTRLCSIISSSHRHVSVSTRFCSLISSRHIVSSVASSVSQVAARSGSLVVVYWPTLFTTVWTIKMSLFNGRLSTQCLTDVTTSSGTVSSCVR